MLPTIDMPEPMRESGPDFVVAGSGPDATCSTTVRDAVLPISSSAFAAVFLSGSGALLLKLFNMLASPCGLNVSAKPFALQTSIKRYHVIRPLSSLRPTFLDPLGGQLRELSAVHESAAMYFGMGHKSS